ncbi:hypothetical protein ACH4UT_34590, partial [Streptomyces sp. NPDC020799]|uniref:hypothetical protein n=1 Tax=Streptomyces sp. NPDC020799 TaxID=3365091 RepID=UPI003788A87E
HSELGTDLVRDAHTTPTSHGTGGNTLMICKPLVAHVSGQVGVAGRSGEVPDLRRQHDVRAGDGTHELPDDSLGVPVPVPVDIGG